MGRVFGWLCLLACAGWVHSAEVGPQREIVYDIVSGKNKGDRLAIYRFLDDGCSFWEYIGGHAYRGRIVRTDTIYRIESTIYAFEYPRPFSSAGSHRAGASHIRYVREEPVRIGRDRIAAGKFDVSDADAEIYIYISEDYSMPLGYDVGRMKVRVRAGDLEEMKAVVCEGP